MTETEVTPWLAAHARPIAVPDDLDDLDDLDGSAAGSDDGVAAWIRAAADARVLALGPAVVGTRELAQLAGRLIDGLVRDAGVRTLALQASESGTTLLDDHVRDPTGAAGSVGGALESLGSWSWNTREVLDVVRGLADAAAGVRIVGVDPRRPATAVRVVGAYLRATDPDTLATVADALADLALGHADGTTRAAVDRVRARLDQDVPALVAATSPAQHTEAVRHATFLARAAELAATSPAGADAVAERLIAEAVLEALRPDEKLVIWAQADHVVAREDPPSAGFHLRARLGDAYRPLVLSAGEGKARGLRRRMLGVSRTPKVHRLPAPPAGSLEADVLAASPRDPVVDLRTLPGPGTPPAVLAWASGGVTRRSVGDEVSSSSPVGAMVPCRPGTDLDGIAVVRTVHPAWAR